MKRIILFLVVIAMVGCGAVWLAKHQPPASAASPATAGLGRKLLYYQSPMHPWIKSDKPGKCPICGMNLVPIYASESGTAATNATASGQVTLASETISTINVQTDPVALHAIRRTLRLSGQIVGNSWQVAWFEFIAYQRDLEWLKVGQTLDVFVTGVPDKVFRAQIKPHGIKPFADSDFDMLAGSTTMRAEISNSPVEPGNLGRYKFFNGLHADAIVVSETEPTLAIPRSAVISRGTGAMVYVDIGDGHYAPCRVELGRIGDGLVEVTGGLKAGEKIVTTGNVLIDSEAQLSAEE